MSRIYLDTVSKPLKPHRKIDKLDIPTKSDIDNRIQRIKRLEELAIEANLLVAGMGDCEEDLDKLEASILIMQDKQVPDELTKKIKEKSGRIV